MAKRTISISIVTIFGLIIMAGIAFATSRYNVTSNLGGVSGDFFDLDGTWTVQSIKVGKQGTAGVTFFNGTIINQTTTDSEGDIPVTFGDNVRIDGIIFRGATEGPGDDFPIKLNDDVLVYGDLTVQGESPFIQSLTAGDNVTLTDNEDGIWTVSATDTDTDTNTDTGTLTFFIAGALSNTYNIDGTYLDSWKPKARKTLEPLRITANAQTPSQGNGFVLRFSDDGNQNYDNVIVQEDNFSSYTEGFVHFNSINNDDGLTIQYISNPTSAPENVNIIIEHEVETE